MLFFNWCHVASITVYITKLISHDISFRNINQRQALPAANNREGVVILKHAYKPCLQYLYQIACKRHLHVKHKELKICYECASLILYSDTLLFFKFCIKYISIW